MARDLRVGPLVLDGRHITINGGVELDRALDGVLAAEALGLRRGLSNGIDQRSLIRIPGRVREHGDARLDAELLRRVRRRDGDLRELVGRRRDVDRAVAEDLDAVVQQHEEDRGHDVEARRRFE